MKGYLVSSFIVLGILFGFIMSPVVFIKVLLCMGVAVLIWMLGAALNDEYFNK